MVMVLSLRLCIFAPVTRNQKYLILELNPLEAGKIFVEFFRKNLTTCTHGIQSVNRNWILSLKKNWGSYQQKTLRSLNYAWPLLPS